jgi:hypothetical protein
MGTSSKELDQGLVTNTMRQVLGSLRLQLKLGGAL